MEAWAALVAWGVLVAWTVRVEPWTGVVISVLVMIPLLVCVVGIAPAPLAYVSVAVSTVLHFPLIPV